MTSPFSLEGRVALITGGSKGIGRSIALTFAGAGADVAIAARGTGELEAVAAEIEGLGRRALAVPTDVSDREAVARLVARTEDELGALDILVNNAGAAPFMSSFESTKLDGFEKYFRVNYLSAVYAMHAAAPGLLGRGSGCVLNVASVAGLTATPGVSYYGSAKAAMIQLTRTTAREWGPSGVRVNALAPGWIDTPMSSAPRQNIPGFEAEISAATPLGRFGTPEEVAGAALFLCAPAASFITGAVLVVDGGITLGSFA
jgi:NAD(P)-dependent dehydrogenase (short-subunit alcohol dehydrogenase family)